MAAAEAKAMLDALMGGERNAPLPPGAAMPRSKKKRKLEQQSGGDLQLQLPGKRSKSCFDKDICPLYCAWGVDVFELFVNTKSDIGPNPYVVDDGARNEYLKLSSQEQQRLGFEYFLFQKLQELVRQGDRTIARNKDKLAQELRRLAAKRGKTTGGSQPVVDYVQDVDEHLLEQLARNQVTMEIMKKQLENDWLPQLEQIQIKEETLKEELSPLLEAQRIARQKQNLKKEEEEEEDGMKSEEQQEKEQKEGDDSAVAVKNEEEKGKEEDTEKNENDDAKDEEKDTPNIKKEEEQDEEDKGNTSAKELTPEETARIQELQIQLGKTTMEKQRLVWDIGKTIGQLAPLQDTMDTQWRNLLYVKSDIAVDKTVCEVSGNFMSARDADERIAAHYAGKQYVGWKLVRGKFKEMIAKYGKYGPPPPDKRGPGGPGEMMG